MGRDESGKSRDESADRWDESAARAGPSVPFPAPFTNQKQETFHVHSNDHRTNDTGQHTTSRTTTQPTNTPTTQLERNAAQRLRTTMAAVRLAFTWLGVRKTLAPEQRTTAARAFHADRELLTAR